jgi:ATP-dependent RNA helicase DeaD
MDKKPFPELGLSPELLQAVTALGFEQPAPIQAQAIPPALEGKDVVGQSQTGSGKTMAFAIPVVQKIDPGERGVRALIMCPTRELAMQVCEEVGKLTAHKPGIKALPIYGGATYDRQIRGLKAGAQIVVGTPGRILDFIERGVMRLDELKMLVFDEADEMLDMGFREDIDKLMEAVPADRQTLFFSATIDGPIRKLVESYTRDPAIITVQHKAMTVPTVEQRFYESHWRSKMEVLCRVLDIENPKLAIVFANTKRTVDDVTDALLARGYAADRLHGDLNQMARDRVMKNFRSGTIEVLVATDVAARGLDVDDVDLVVNYDLPYDEEDYVHRIGRTGRAGRSGKAASLVSGRDIFLLQRIQRYAKVKIERAIVPTRDEVEGQRIDTHLEELQETLDKGEYKAREATIQQLLDSGHSATEIAGALLHLWLESSARESEEIVEDRPRPERRPAREYRQEGEPRDMRESRERPEGGHSARPAFQHGGGQAFTRLFINIGAMDQVTPREISGMIYRSADLPPGSLGKIEIYDKCSYVGVPPEFVEKVMETVSQNSFRGRGVRMDVADQQGFREPNRGYGPPRGGGGGGGGGGFGFKRPYGGGGGGQGGFRPGPRRSAPLREEGGGREAGAEEQKPAAPRSPEPPRPKKESFDWSQEGGWE